MPQKDKSALFVMDGVKGGHDGMSYSNPKKFRKKSKRRLIFIVWPRRYVQVTVLPWRKRLHLLKARTAPISKKHRNCFRSFCPIQAIRSVLGLRVFRVQEKAHLSKHSARCCARWANVLRYSQSTRVRPFPGGVF